MQGDVLLNCGVWKFWEGEAPAEPLRLGVCCEVVVVIVREVKKGGGSAGASPSRDAGWGKIRGVLNHEWTRMNAGECVIDLRYVDVLGGRGSCRALEVGFAL